MQERGKGIITIHIPKNCLECSFISDYGYCVVNHNDVFRFAISFDKPKECPIKPIPTRKPQDQLTPSPMIKEYYNLYDEGWNDCLDAVIYGVKALEPQWIEEWLAMLNSEED